MPRSINAEVTQSSRPGRPEAQPVSRSGWVGPAHRRSTVERAPSRARHAPGDHAQERWCAGLDRCGVQEGHRDPVLLEPGRDVDDEAARVAKSGLSQDAGPRHESDTERDDGLEIAGLHDVGDVWQIKGTPSGAKGRREVGRRTVRADAVQDDLDVGVAVNVGWQSGRIVRDPLDPSGDRAPWETPFELEDQAVEARMVCGTDLDERRDRRRDYAAASDEAEPEASGRPGGRWPSRRINPPPRPARRPCDGWATAGRVSVAYVATPRPRGLGIGDDYPSGQSSGSAGYVDQAKTRPCGVTTISKALAMTMLSSFAYQ